MVDQGDHELDAANMIAARRNLATPRSEINAAFRHVHDLCRLQRGLGAWPRADASVSRTALESRLRGRHWITVSDEHAQSPSRPRERPSSRKAVFCAEHSRRREQPSRDGAPASSPDGARGRACDDSHAMLVLYGSTTMGAQASRACRAARCGGCSRRTHGASRYPPVVRGEAHGPWRRAARRRGPAGLRARTHRPTGRGGPLSVRLGRPRADRGARRDLSHHAGADRRRGDGPSRPGRAQPLARSGV